MRNRSQENRGGIDACYYQTNTRTEHRKRDRERDRERERETDRQTKAKEKEKAKAKETEKKKTTRSVASRYSSSFLLLSFISNLFYFSYPLLDYIHMGLRPPPSPCACHVSVCVKTVVYAHPIHPY